MTRSGIIMPESQRVATCREVISTDIFEKLASYYDQLGQEEAARVILPNEEPPAGWTVAISI